MNILTVSLMTIVGVVLFIVAISSIFYLIGYSVTKGALVAKKEQTAEDVKELTTALEKLYGKDALTKLLDEKKDDEKNTQ